MINLGAILPAIGTAFKTALPYIKKAMPYVLNAGGALGGSLLSGDTNNTDSNGSTYQPVVAGDSGMVPNNGNSLYSRIAGGNSGGMGIMPPEGGQSLFDRLRRQY